MKIGIPSTEPNLDGMVENKLGIAAHLLVIETDDMSFEVLKGPSHSSGPGAGMQAISQVMDMGAQVIIVGYISPYIAEIWAKQGIEIVDQVSGSVRKVVTSYTDSRSLPPPGKDEPDPGKSTSKNQWITAMGMGLRQFYSFLPMLIGVILLLGLFQGFVSEQTLVSFFPGTALQDSFWGAFLGSILTGNPVNSYVIGKSLLNIGVGLSGVTALMLAWVNVGLIQLPAEAKALGIRFALIRNIAGFVVAVMMSFVVAWLAGGNG
jgi:predicted Fe-Mo cluster-binding NifX family protein